MLGKNAGFHNPHMFEIMSGMEEAVAKKGYLLCVKSISAEQACEFVEKIFDSKEAGRPGAACLRGITGAGRTGDGEGNSPYCNRKPGFSQPFQLDRY